MKHCEFCKLNARFSDCANRKRAGAKIEAKLKVLDCQKREKKNINGELEKNAVEGASEKSKVRTSKRINPLTC